MSGNGVRSICVCLLLLGLSAATRGKVYHFAGGTGEPNDPYQIATAEQLISIGSDPNLLDKHFALLNDIDLDPNLPGGRVFTQAVIAPRGSSWPGFSGMRDESGTFKGNFDGRGHSIRNLTIHSGLGNQLALFGYIGYAGLVRDLGVDDALVSVEAGSCHAALAGRNDGRIVRCRAKACLAGACSVGVLAGYNSGEIIDCWSEGDALGEREIGGLAGRNLSGVILRSHAACRVLSIRAFSTESGGLVGLNAGIIIRCWATGAVSPQSGSAHGGLVGANDFGAIIAQSYATGNVSAAARAACLGGLVGYAIAEGYIHDCYATGNVSGNGDDSYIGGLIGRTNGPNGGVTDCYYAGRITVGKSGTNIGGLLGCRYGGEVTRCFWDTEVSGLSESAGGTGLTTAQMQDVVTFAEAGWDLADEQANGPFDVWSMPEEGGYPQLTAHSAVFHPHKLEGGGAPGDPYRIATAQDLSAIDHYDPTACYRLEADIDLAGVVWRRAPIECVAGQFDGAGRILRGLDIRGTGGLGLFNIISHRASVMDLGVRDANIAGERNCGALAGQNFGCITACCASGCVAGAVSLGGLVGSNEGAISDSYATSIVRASSALNIGGLVGTNHGPVDRCYAAAHVIFVPPSSWGFVGGLVGWSGSDLATKRSYFLIDTDGGGLDNGCGKALTNVRMKERASFADWDFDTVWTIREGEDYPRLWWERPR